MTVDNYDNFLKDSVGLNYMTRKIALRVKPQPTWWIEEVESPTGRGTVAALKCRVECFGAKTINETYLGAETQEKVHDVNVPGVVWDMRTWWEDGGVLCSEKVAPSQNGGRPLLCRRVVTADNLLTVTQEWAPGKVFTQVLTRA